jgi:hypothetical protein
MRRLLAAAILPVLLPACTITPPKNAKPSAENVALTCGALPVTENLWGDSYTNMANSRVDPDWAQPFYEGFGTAARVLATPFYVIADVLVAPLRVGQPCAPSATPAPAAVPRARPTPGARQPAYRKPSATEAASGSGYSRPHSRPAPPPPAAEPDLEP